MGDHKSGLSSKAGISSSKTEETPQHTPTSPKSYSSPTTSGRAPGFGESYVSSSTNRGSSDETAVGDDNENYDNDQGEELIESEEERHEDPEPAKIKRLSSHANVYTECGRHSDDWLFKGITDIAKSVKNTLGKNEKK
jgi:hypothetical protein